MITKLLFSLLLTTVFSVKVAVHTPLALKDMLGDGGELSVQQANFGHLEYGTSFLAQLYRPTTEAVR